jgi:SAM-dependent methyltransferase
VAHTIDTEQPTGGKSGSKSPRQAAQKHKAVAERRLETLARHVGLKGKAVLEFGTGRGHLAALLPKAGAIRVVGVESRSYPEWDKGDQKKVELIAGDLGNENLVDPESVDVVVSAGAFDRLAEPVQALGQLYRALAAGGEAWLYFSLYRGPGPGAKRDGLLPWPHLLAETLDEQQLQELGGAPELRWINRMTVAEYAQACVETGYEIAELRRHTVELEQLIPIYKRFRRTLSRYPALDLETDALTLVLRKVSEPVERMPRLGYLERQREFAALLAR